MLTVCTVVAAPPVAIGRFCNCLRVTCHIFLFFLFDGLTPPACFYSELIPKLSSNGLSVFGCMMIGQLHFSCHSDRF